MLQPLHYIPTLLINGILEKEMKVLRKFTNIFIYFIIIVLMLNVVQAQEINIVSSKAILEQINNGTDVNLDNVQIIGDLYIGGPESGSYYTEGNNSAPILFPLNTSVIESNIIIINSNFKNVFVVNNVEFNNSLFFGNTNFSNIIYFRDVNFNGTVDFMHVNFINNVYYLNTNFSSDVNFEHVNFNSAIFNEIIFNGESNFNFTTFNDYAKFKNIFFNKNSHFNSAHFKGDTIFENVTFNNQVSFFGAEFIGDNPIKITYFNKTNFIGDASFTFSSFNGRTYFWNSNFYKNADFSLTNFNLLIFENTTFVDVGFYESYFEIMRVEWKYIKNALTFEGTTYLRLMKNFREIEQFDDADDVYYEYQEQKRKNEGGLEDSLFWIVSGYGVKPLRPIGIGLAIIMVFPLIYLFGMSKSAALECSGIAFLSGYNHDFINNNFFTRFPSLETKIGIISRGVLNGKRLIKFFMFSESLLGWLVLGLFIVTLANVMIRP